MTALLPFLSLFFVSVYLSGAFRRAKPLDEAGAFFVVGLLLWSAGVYCLTEILSLFGSLSRGYLLSAHALAALVSLVLIFARIKQRSFHPPRFADTIRRAPLSRQMIIALILVLYIMPLFFVAVYFLPDTGDSMTYHLSRIEHWIQNRNVGHYPVWDIRQIFHQPMAEYIVLQLRLALGSHAFSGLAQFVFMLGTLAAVSQLARRFGLGARGRLLAVVIALTVPTGILEATSTQTDYIAAFYFISFVWLGMVAVGRRAAGGTGAPFLLSVLALALGMLTKGTVYLFALPFLAWFAIAFTRRNPPRRVITAILLLCAVALAVNGPYYARNFRLTGSVFGDPALRAGVFTGSPGLKNTAVNLVKTAGTQLGLPHKAYNRAAERAAAGAVSALGADINDPETTFLSEPYRVEWSTHESVAGNFMPFTAFLPAAIIFAARFRRYGPDGRRAGIYLLCLLAGGLAFTATFKWQPWISRLLLPIMAAASVFMAFVADKLPVGRKLIPALMAALLFFSWIFVLDNHTKSLAGLWADYRDGAVAPRAERYFDSIADEPEPYRREYFHLTDMVKRHEAGSLGLAIKGSLWEYPLWQRLDTGPEGVTIRHIRYPYYMKKSPNYEPGRVFDAILVSRDFLPDHRPERGVAARYDYDNLEAVLFILEYGSRQRK